MTNEEAIKKLEELCEYKGYNYTVITDKDVEALHMALEALRKVVIAEKLVFLTEEMEADDEQ